MMRWSATSLCAAMLALLTGCAPPDPGLEAAMLLAPAANPAPQGPQQASVAPDIPVNPVPLRRQTRVLNLDPVHVTNNVYGPGLSSDTYGNVVHHRPGQQIKRVPGTSRSYEDQYGHSVSCYTTGMGTYCQ